MKKETTTLLKKSKKELMEEVETLRKEIAVLKLNKRVKPEKDTNLIGKKKQRIAYVLTMVRQIELTELQKQP